jgi:hypothetical protein
VVPRLRPRTGAEKAGRPGRTDQAAPTPGAT